MEVKTNSSDSEEKHSHVVSPGSILEKKDEKKRTGMTIEGYRIDGLSIAGHETCIILPTLNLAFDIGRCPPRAVAQQFLFISHGHMDHIGGLPMYVATRGLYRMAPPTIIVPTVIKESVEKLFEAHRAMDHSELKHNLIGLNVGEEFQLRKDLKVKAFKTYHCIPSQGYIVYSVRQKLKQEYVGLPGSEIKNLKLSGVELYPETKITTHNMYVCKENIGDENIVEAGNSLKAQNTNQCDLEPCHAHIQSAVKGLQGKKKRKNINDILGFTRVKSANTNSKVGRKKGKCVLLRSVVASAALSASISSEGINNRNRILLDEAQAIWAINKLHGINYDGDEQEVISKIAELESKNKGLADCHL